MVRLGLCSGAYINRDARGVIGAAVAARLDAIEWAADAHIGIGDHKAAERLMMETLSAGLTTASYATLYRVGPDDGELGRFDALLETASILHAPIMRLYAWGNSVDADDSAGSRYKAFSARVSQFQRLGDRAAAKGITLCMSMGRGDCLERYARAIRLVGAIDHEFVKMTWEDLPGATAEDATSALVRLGRHAALIIARCAAKDGKPLPLVPEDWKARIQSFKRCEGDHKMSKFVLLGASRPEDPAGDLSLAADAAALRSLVSEDGSNR
jgi:hypothetical protein